MKKRIQDVLLLAVGWLLWCSAVLAQTTTQINSPIISAGASGDRVRITAPASIVQMRVEVYDRNGAKVWDSEIHGNVFDWQLQDGQAQRVAAADYFCVITVKNLAGRLSQRTGSIQIGEKDVHVGTADVRKLSAPQSQAIGPVEEDASWTIVSAAPNQTTTVIGHDGKDGQITRGRGAFSFQLGDFYSGNSQEQMRLTEEGSLGIGTSKPKFKLDVAGAIRARGGFVFNDGSTLNVNEQGVLTRTSADGNITPNAAGTGTQGRLAKWTDNVGTLGDSVITENGGAIGIGNSNPDSLVNIQGPIPTLLGKLAVIRSTGANNGFGLQMDAVGSGNNAVGLAVNGVPKAAFSWDNSRQFLGLVNFAYSQNDFALRVNVDGSLTYHDGMTSAERFRITKDGNVGIGATSPGFKLDVIGTINSSTQYDLNGSRILASPGTKNLFVGANSGASNSGQGNSFFGSDSGTSNISGSNNTLIGTGANVGSSGLQYATAIGAGAKVNRNNQLVLGRSEDDVLVPGNLTSSQSIGANSVVSSSLTTSLLMADFIRPAQTGSVALQDLGGNVGIGTTDPTSVLHIVGHAPAPNPFGEGANAGPVLQVVGGNGGDGVFGGDGGGVVARAGNGGHGSVFGGSGGGVAVYGGDAGVGDQSGGFFGGSITLQGGTGGGFGNTGGSITLQGGKDSAGPFSGSGRLDLQPSGGDIAMFGGKFLFRDSDLYIPEASTFRVGPDSSSDKSLKISGVNRTRLNINSSQYIFGQPSVADSGLVLSANNYPQWSFVTSNNSTLQINNEAYGGNAITITANNRVGIGNPNPSDKLNVNGTVSLLLAGGGSYFVCQNSTTFQLAVCSSSIRYKKNINNFSSGLRLLNRLRPVTFNWKNDNKADVGLIAEEVGAVEPLLVTHNDKGEIEGVKYDRVGVVLINAIKEQQAQIEKQQKLIAIQQQEIAALKKIVCAKTRAALICKR